MKMFDFRGDAEYRARLSRISQLRKPALMFMQTVIQAKWAPLWLTPW